MKFFWVGGAMGCVGSFIGLLIKGGYENLPWVMLGAGCVCAAVSDLCEKKK